MLDYLELCVICYPSRTHTPPLALCLRILSLLQSHLWPNEVGAAARSCDQSSALPTCTTIRLSSERTNRLAGQYCRKFWTQTVQQSSKSIYATPLSLHVRPMICLCMCHAEIFVSRSNVIAPKNLKAITFHLLTVHGYILTKVTRTGCAR